MKTRLRKNRVRCLFFIPIRQPLKLRNRPALRNLIPLKLNKFRHYEKKRGAIGAPFFDLLRVFLVPWVLNQIGVTQQGLRRNRINIPVLVTHGSRILELPVGSKLTESYQVVPSPEFDVQLTTAFVKQLLLTYSAQWCSSPEGTKFVYQSCG
jgi:hypothetical protein